MAIVPLPTAERNLAPGYQKVIDYLAERGIPNSPSFRDKYGIRIQAAIDFKKHGDNRLAAVFTHYDIHGQPIEWYSTRLIEVQPSFGSVAHRAKTYCPPKEIPHAYLPPTLDWTNIPEGSPVFIHESVLKSIAGAELGFYSIGLNGVWGWGSKKHEVALLPELRDLPWTAKKLHCVVVFDSNYDTNDDVHAAIAKFAERMGMLAKVSVTHLALPKPPAEFGKADWGFDDYVVWYGVDTGRAFLEGWKENAGPAGLSELEMMKLDLNSKVAVVRNMSCVVEIETGTVMRRSAFTDVNYAHYVAAVEKKDDKVEHVNVPRLWLSDPRRTTVTRISYTPGQPTIYDDSYNTWRPSECYPVEGPVHLWLQLLEFSIPDPEIREWFINWLAYPIQHPGKKMDTFVFIYGFPGTGKQAALAPMLHIYGSTNAITVGKEQLDANFNSVYAQRQFVVFDEMNKGAHSDPVALYNKLKKLTTLDTLVVNTKGIPEYTIDNRLNFSVIGNYPDALKLDDEDRRCCVIEFGSRDKTLGKEWFQDYFDWVNSVGAPYIYNYLLTKDLSGFDPHGDAPMTEIKQLATTASRRADEQWIADLWDDPDQVLLPNFAGRCLFTNEELAVMCYADMNEPPSAPLKKGFGVKMHAAGFRRLPLKIGSKVIWFYVVRKKDVQWTAEMIRKHLKLFAYPGV